MNNYEINEENLLQLAQEAYNAGEASFEVNSSRCACLIIDMQDEFVKPAWSPFWIPEATKQVPRIQQLISHCRSKKIPVIYTVYMRLHNSLARSRSGFSMPNRYRQLTVNQSQYFLTERIYSELSPQPQDVIIHKSTYGAFYDTPLDTILKNLGKDMVIICGTLTNFCCGMTARQAYERGYYVIFGSDITATDDPAMQEPELKTLRKGFAKVLSVKEILSAL